MIRNVVFDVGNVFVCWSPPEVVRRCFDVPPDSDENRRWASILFRSPIWIGLNLGEFTQAEAQSAYRAQLGLTERETDALFFHVMDHQVPIDGTEALASRLRRARYRLFGLTDNVREIVVHSKTRYRFWDLFEGTIVSAEIGMMKPDHAIFRHLLMSFGLAPNETVFFDDHEPNTEGARAVGIESFVFTTAERCEHDLLSLGMSF
jgi:putative hydrolase of the HAD superfamily